MYCYHCGKKLDRKKLEEKQSSYASVDASLIDDDTKINYVCPRCGHLVYEGMTEEERAMQVREMWQYVNTQVDNNLQEAIES